MKLEPRCLARSPLRVAVIVTLTTCKLRDNMLRVKPGNTDVHMLDGNIHRFNRKKRKPADRSMLDGIVLKHSEREGKAAEIIIKKGEYRLGMQTFLNSYTKVGINLLAYINTAR